MPRKRLSKEVMAAKYPNLAKGWTSRPRPENVGAFGGVTKAQRETLAKLSEWTRLEREWMAAAEAEDKSATYLP